MLKTDRRKVERKHTGLYKARAKYPYRRRWN
jgi:ribosomal protein S9